MWLFELLVYTLTPAKNRNAPRWFHTPWPAHKACRQVTRTTTSTSNKSTVKIRWRDANTTYIVYQSVTRSNVIEPCLDLLPVKLFQVWIVKDSSFVVQTGWWSSMYEPPYQFEKINDQIWITGDEVSLDLMKEIWEIENIGNRTHIIEPRFLSLSLKLIIISESLNYFKTASSKMIFKRTCSACEPGYQLIIS